MKHTFTLLAAFLLPLLFGGPTGWAQEPKSAAIRDMGKIYDPLLDPNCKIIDQSTKKISGQSKWDALWMWYPGQYTAALNARAVQLSLKKGSNIGYPGNFTQLQTYAYFRAKANPAEKASIRWEGPSGRTALLVDNKGTLLSQRELTLQAGPSDIEVKVDFASGLPCLMVEGAGVSSPKAWEVSLDGKNWTTPEYIEGFNNPGLLPDKPTDITLRIPVNKVLHPVNVKISGDAYKFGTGGEAIFDFWHDELGCLAFDVQGSGEISVFVGESPEEAMNSNKSFFEQKALAPIILSGSPTSIILPERALRYARIHTTGPCKISNLHFQARVTPVEYRGHFTCNDQKINEIWKAGAATLHACMHDFYLDGIKRDGLSWSYDGQIGLTGGDMVFYDRTIARNLNISQLLPKNPEKKDIGIVDYPLHTILGFEHEYAVSGDLDFLRIYKSRIYEILDLYMTMQDENGFVSGGGIGEWGFFPEWVKSKSGPDVRATPAYAQMILMHALEIGAYFARELSDSQKAANYENAAGKLRLNIRKEFWDSGRGAFINGFDRMGKPDKRFTPYAQVWGILFGLVRPEEYQGVFEKVLDSPERATTLKTQVAQNLFFEMEACFLAGRTERAVNLTREIFGRLIDAGYSRIMEDIDFDKTPVEQLAFYNRPFGKSLCNIWSGAVPVYVLNRGVLGINPVAPGYRLCTFRPDLGGLEWVKGSVPVPGGSISVEMNRSSGKLTLPPGVEASLVNVTGEKGEKSFRGPGVFPFRWVSR